MSATQTIDRAFLVTKPAPSETKLTPAEAEKRYVCVLKRLAQSRGHRADSLDLHDLAGQLGHDKAAVQADLKSIASLLHWRSCVGKGAGAW